MIRTTALFTLAALLCAGCSTPRHVYPDPLREQCQLALDKAEQETGMKSSGAWTVETAPATYRVDGVPCFLTPDGDYRPFWTSSDGEMSVIESSPACPYDVDYAMLYAAAREHVIRSASKR
jgi:hypothetical protein